ncbi:hypothetical protein BLOT_003385 [Blomia tropicalis]|nr:hypothetical protein BLOT_003385 [Blomia tropicalis]
MIIVFNVQFNSIEFSEKEEEERLCIEILDSNKEKEIARLNRMMAKHLLLLPLQQQVDVALH